MNAPVVRITAAPSAERRRASTIRDVASSLAALELTIRAKVPTLGNREAYVALRAAYEKLDHELSRVECLADEFLGMAQAEEEEQPE